MWGNGREKIRCEKKITSKQGAKFRDVQSTKKIKEKNSIKHEI